MPKAARARGMVPGAVALLVAAACADPTMPSRALLPEQSSQQILTPEVIDFLQNGWPEGLFDGDVRLCKTTEEGDPGGTFTFTVTKVGTGVIGTPLITVPAGGGTVCETVYTSTVLNADDPEQIVITENVIPNWSTQDIDIRRLLLLAIVGGNFPGGYTFPRLNDALNLGDRSATVFINSDMVRVVRFRNAFQEPPPDVCDFITFGRLVIEVGGEKVVISGNAGGFNADQSIKNEFHIDANDVDNHVADAFSYGPITSGPLSNLLNSRIVTGTAKNGVEVELRVWDGGEPGKDTDLVYVKLDGVELLGPGGQFVDIGNMQYHSNCRGPG